jgi:hypothetical protein
MTRLTCAILLLLAAPLPAAAEEAAPPPAVQAAPAQPPAAPQPPAAEPQPPATAAAAPAPPAPKPFSIQVGWGYYEVTHAGVAWHPNPRAALDLFAGGGLAWDAKTIAVGAGYRHHVGPPFWTLQAGWNLKAIFWTQSDANYDWKNLSFVLGPYLMRDLDRRLSLKLDGGVALTAALESGRKQNEHFASPQRWNGSVCLELVYRLGGS